MKRKDDVDDEIDFFSFFGRKEYEILKIREKRKRNRERERERWERQENEIEDRREKGRRNDLLASYYCTECLCTYIITHFKHVDHYHSSLSFCYSLSLSSSPFFSLKGKQVRHGIFPLGMVKCRKRGSNGRRGKWENEERDEKRLMNRKPSLGFRKMKLIPFSLLPLSPTFFPFLGLVLVINSLTSHLHSRILIFFPFISFIFQHFFLFFLALSSPTPPPPPEASWSSSSSLFIMMITMLSYISLHFFSPLFLPFFVSRKSQIVKAQKMYIIISFSVQTFIAYIQQQQSYLYTNL